MSDLRARISSASLAQGTTALLGKASNVVLGIVLARLLFPEDYGLFAVTLIVTSLANMLSNFGFQSYIIQVRELNSATINTCYTLNVLLSIALGAVVALIGLLWPDPPLFLPQMMLLYGLHVFISGLSYIELALLKRDLDFVRSSRAELAYTVTSMGGRVAFAFANFGALCFPLGDVIGALVRYLLVREMSRCTPRIVLPRPGESSAALWFGMHSTSVGLASFFGNQTDKFLITTQFPMASVGLFAFASNAAAMFYSAFIVPQTSVFLATFARLRDDAVAARQVLATSSRLIYSLALPVNILLLLETEHILSAVYTDKWLPAAVLVRIFAIDFIVRSMVSSIAGLQMSFGLAGAASKTKWRSALLVVAALLVATALGADIVGYAVASVVGNLLAALHNTWVNGRLIDVRWLDYLRNLMAPTIIAFASTLAWWLTRPAWVDWTLWPALVAACLVWLLSYLCLTAVFNRMVFDVLFSTLRNKAR